MIIRNVGGGVRIVRIPMPEYRISRVPDYAVSGPRLDGVVTEAFPNSRLALRGIFLDDHPGVSRDELEAVLLEAGTDRYDPSRRGMHHEYYDRLGVELHAVPAETSTTLRGLDAGDYAAAASFFGEFMRDFYESAAAERGYPLRLDIVSVYDLDALVAPAGGGAMGYAFDPGVSPVTALRGIVHVLRSSEV